MKSFTGILIRNAHPDSLIISCGSVMFGFAAAVIRGGISLFPAFMTLLFALLLQISSNLLYSYLDVSKVLKENVGFRTIVFDFHDMSRTKVRLLKVSSNGFAILAATAGLPLFTFIGWIGVMYVAVIMILLYFYFAGPRAIVNTPYSLLMTFVVFGPLAVSGTALIQDARNVQWLPVLVYSCISGFMACNFHIAIQYKRLQEDMGKGKQTLLIAGGFGMIRYIYLFNSLAVAVILNFRPCVYDVVPQWVPAVLGAALLLSSLYVVSFMKSYSLRNIRKINSVTRGQYVVFILVIVLIVVGSIQDYKLNLLHLI